MGTKLERTYLNGPSIKDVTTLEGGGALCFEWGFTRTFSGNQDVAVK